MDKPVELTREQVYRLLSLNKDAIAFLLSLLNDERHLLRWDDVSREWVVTLRR